ncbi:sulfite exporter TauE/SafE family protein [Streptomyces malaysiensis]|uniref:sulfite exporter TauE/SafE family protein n=1 Tax=Streptomyces malaysiensis TaxID=92644 RepID=UPI002B296524|nr:sulfite exporter TauE/SafE family protein [Streptomyces malaysiensis]
MVGGQGSAGIARVGRTLGAEVEVICAVAEGGRWRGGGIGGVVFLFPVQLSVFTVPNPAVTPANLLCNVVSGPGALLRYRCDGVLTGPFVCRMVVGTLPGVVLEAVIRVFALPGRRVFRLLVAVLMLPLGTWLIVRALRPVPAKVCDVPGPRLGRSPSWCWRSGLWAVFTVSAVVRFSAPSLSGVVFLFPRSPRPRSPPLCHLGGGRFRLRRAVPGPQRQHRPRLAPRPGPGLIGGYVGARLQPCMPETVLRLLLGTLAAVLGVVLRDQRTALTWPISLQYRGTPGVGWSGSFATTGFQVLPPRLSRTSPSDRERIPGRKAQDARAVWPRHTWSHRPGSVCLVGVQATGTACGCAEVAPWWFRAAR